MSSELGHHPERVHCENHAFDVRAAPNELHRRVADPQLANTGESSTFLFESSRDGAEVGDVKISKDLRLDSRIRQPTNVVVKSFGAFIRRKSTEPCRAAHREFSSVDQRVHLPDVGSDGRVEHQICALSVQTIPGRNHWIPHEYLVVTVGNIASLRVFPKKWKQHVTQMPTSRG